MSGWLRVSAVAFGTIAFAVGGCSGAGSPLAEAGSHGRFVGVGIYGPGKSWTRMVAAQSSKNGAAARPIDDQVILVVTDSQTGELRACGDLTGYCIGMNPWKQPLPRSRVSPIDLTAHVKPDDPNLTVEIGPLKQHDRHRHTRRPPPTTPAETQSASA